MNAEYGYSIGFTKGYSYPSGWGFESGMRFYVNHFRGKYYAYPPWRDFTHTYSFYYNYQPAWLTVYNHYTMMYLAVPLLAKYDWTVPSGSKFFVRSGLQFEACFSSGYDRVGVYDPYVESGIFRQEYHYKKPCVVSFFLGLGTDIHFKNDRYLRLEAQSSVGFLSNTQNNMLPFTAGISVSSPFRIRSYEEVLEKRASRKEKKKQNKEASKGYPNNAIYFEGLGAGGLFSLNYERTLGYQPERAVNTMIRTGIVWLDENPGLLGGMHYRIGKKKLKAELGGGIASDGDDTWQYLNIGLRYEPQNRLLLRASFTPIFESFHYGMPFGGVSIGFRW